MTSNAKSRNYRILTVTQLSDLVHLIMSPQKTNLGFSFEDVLVLNDSDHHYAQNGRWLVVWKGFLLGILWSSGKDQTTVSRKLRGLLSHRERGKVGRLIHLKGLTHCGEYQGAVL